MMDWTDRHDRFFLRQISRHARLYTEMLTADAILHGDKDRLLNFNEVEHPVALQLGGSDVRKLNEAAKIGTDYGYDEINLNVGCPSPRVQSGRFGACLMQEPDLVADLVAGMNAATHLPVTVKCRIGVDEQDPETALFTLVEKSKQAGCAVFIVHARKAWLDGLSPKQNRDVPPLDYDLVYRLKQAHPDLVIVLNGGIDTLAQAQTLLEAEKHSEKLDGVMLGRTAYKTPYVLCDVDRLFYGDETPPPSREEVIEKIMPYAETIISSGVALHALTRHLMGLFQAQTGGRLWRRFLSDNAPQQGANADILRQGLVMMRDIKTRATQYAATQYKSGNAGIPNASPLEHGNIKKEQL